MPLADKQENIVEPVPTTSDVESASPAQAGSADVDKQPMVEPAPTEQRSTTPSVDEAATEQVPVIAVAPSAVSEQVKESLVARKIAFSQSTVDLLNFVRFTDFVPCDYNKDGIVDILAVNSKLSTGYGFCGIGNGLFKEGPSFDLPFRPVAAAELGNSGDAINGLFLVSSVGTVSLFYPLLDDDPTMRSKAARFSVFRVDTASGPVLAVHGEDDTSVRIYSLVGAGLQDSGECGVVRTDDITDWYNQVTTWGLSDMQAAFPLPPVGMEKTARIADLNGDNIPDLIYYDSGKIDCLLSEDGGALILEQTVPCHAKPVALRIADVDGNGLPDVLALIGSSGVLEVYLTEPT